MVKTWMKQLLKLDTKLRFRIKLILEQIISGDIEDLDIKKIVGRRNYYRCRVGNIRIVYENIHGEVVIKNIDYRGGIYKKY